MNDRRKAYLAFAVELAAVVSATALAGYLRFWLLSDIPPGLNHDEAYDALDGLAVLRGGGLPVFFPENFGREALFMYVLALFQGLFGAEPLSARSAAATVGTLTIPALYLVVRCLHGRLAATFAAFALAVSLWHLVLSRIAQRLIMLPLVECLAFWLAIRAVRRGKPFDFALAGVALAVCLYTYTAARLVPAVIAVGLLFLLLTQRDWLGKHWRAALLFPIAATIAFAPLGWYFVQRPVQFYERIGQVVAGEDAAAAPVGGVDPGNIRENPIRTAAMFLAHGDENLPANLPGRPAFDLALGAAFVVGLSACFSGKNKQSSWFVLLWLVVMSLPSALSLYAPNFQRSVGALPPAQAFAGIGLATLVSWGRRLGLAGRILSVGVAMAALAYGGWSTYHDYFEVWAEDPATYTVFGGGIADLARAIRDRASDQPVYVTPLDGRHPTLRYLARRDDIRGFDGRNGVVLAPPGSAAYGVFPQSDRTTEPALGDAYPGSTPLLRVEDPFGQVFGVLTPVSGRPLLPRYRPLDARFGDFVRLLGSEVPRSLDSSPLEVQLVWAVERPALDPLSVFVHVLGPAGTDGNRLVAQHDAQPIGGSYPTTEWRTGEIVVERISMPRPGILGSGRYELVAGIYDARTGQRVPAAGADSAGDQVLLLVENR